MKISVVFAVPRAKERFREAGALPVKGHGGGDVPQLLVHQRLEPKLLAHEPVQDVGQPPDGTRVALMLIKRRTMMIYLSSIHMAKYAMKDVHNDVCIREQSCHIRRDCRADKEDAVALLLLHFY